jgi:hypothetical protein
MAGGLVSRFYWALSVVWFVLMAGRMIAGDDWRFECVIGTLCLVLSGLYEER